MSSQLIKDYRVLLRHLNKLPSGKMYKKQVLLSIVEGKTMTDANEIALQKEVLSSYVRKVTSVSQLVYLRSLDTGDKLTPQEIIRRTAGKVGFQLPSQYNANSI